MENHSNSATRAKSRLTHIAIGVLIMSPFILLYGWMWWHGNSF